MKLCFLIFLTAIRICFTRDFYSLSCFEGRVFVLDGFEKQILVFDKDGTQSEKISLKSISQSGYFDHFIQYDKYLSYLTDAVGKKVYLLDENYRLKKSSDIELPDNKGMYRKIFPKAYNSIIMADEDCITIYNLTNNSLKEIISSDKPFRDFFYSDGRIYVLLAGNLSVYDPEGIFLRSVNTDSKYNFIFAENDLVLAGSIEKFTLFDLKERTSVEYHAEKDSRPFILNGRLYLYFPGSRNLKQVVNE